MTTRTRNWTDADAAQRAADIGFPLDVLNPTVHVWIAGMNSGSPLHAVNYPGTMAWHQAIPTLRLEGLRFGLEAVRRKGVELCVCAATRVGVVIAQGDGRTGDTENLHIKPTTKYPRGPVSSAVLKAQLSLFPDTEDDDSDDEPYEVWILMMHKTPTGETKAELSRPRTIDESGTILDWHERIFIGTFPEDVPDAARLPKPDLTPTGDIVVPVKKRS